MTKGSRMGRFIAAVALTFALGLVSAARAQSPVLVELFTSQGCSSCPPADAFLGKLAERDDVVALSLHVDYWDYLGWRDVFGKAAHTKRQRAYAATMRERMVYTPQIIVQGREAMVGSRTAKVDEAIGRLIAAPAPAAIDLAAENGKVKARITPVDGASPKGRVMMVWFNSAEEVAIGAGENRGRSITYHNVVGGLWEGGAVELSAPKPMDADGVAVFVQDGKGGPVLCVAKLMLRPGG